MSWLFLVIFVIVMAFGLVVFFGAPYLPTFSKQTDAAFELLALKRGQTLLELGCGDGRVLKVAARHGYKAVGYELNPILVLYARMSTWRYRKDVSIIWGNYWQKTWPKTDGIFVFLLDKYMQKLSNKIEQEFDNPVKLVSFAFKVPGKKIIKEKDGVYLYTYK